MYIDIHTHHAPRPGVLSIRSYSVEEYLSQEAFCGTADEKISIGIYPFDTERISEEMFLKLNSWLGREQILAVGEIGLDYRAEFRASVNSQKEVFRRQIEMANQNRKPIVIHQVRALDDTLMLLGKARTSVLFHGFSGSVESAARILREGYYLSFGAMLLRNRRTEEALLSAPSERIFFETDQADCSIEEIYAKAAECLKLSVQELKNRVKNNFKNFLDKK